MCTLTDSLFMPDLVHYHTLGSLRFSQEPICKTGEIALQCQILEQLDASHCGLSAQWQDSLPSRWWGSFSMDPTQG
jgi:hypothetical protein